MDKEKRIKRAVEIWQAEMDVGAAQFALETIKLKWTLEDAIRAMAGILPPPASPEVVAEKLFRWLELRAMK